MTVGDSSTVMARASSPLADASGYQTRPFRGWKPDASAREHGCYGSRWDVLLRSCRRIAHGYLEIRVGRRSGIPDGATDKKVPQEQERDPPVTHPEWREWLRCLRSLLFMTCLHREREDSSWNRRKRREQRILQIASPLS